MRRLRLARVFFYQHSHFDAAHARERANERAYAKAAIEQRRVRTPHARDGRFDSTTAIRKCFWVTIAREKNGLRIGGRFEAAAAGPRVILRVSGGIRNYGRKKNGCRTRRNEQREQKAHANDRRRAKMDDARFCGDDGGDSGGCSGKISSATLS